MTTSEPAARAGSFLFLSFSCPLRTIANGLHYTAPHARARKPEDAAAAAAGDCPCATLRVTILAHQQSRAMRWRALH